MSERIRIDFLLGDLTLGGAQRTFHNLLKYLDMKKFQPRVLYWRGGFFEDEYKKIKGLELVKIGKEPKGGFSNIGAAFEHIREAIKTIRENKTHVLQTTMHIPNLYSVFIKRAIPDLIVVCRKIDLYPPSKWNPFVKLFFYIESRYYDLIIATSNALKKYLIKNEFLNEKKIRLLYNAVDVERFIPKRDKQEKFIVGFVGRIDEKHKGISHLIDAQRILEEKYKDIELWIIGSGPDEEMLKKHAKGTQTKFLGAKKNMNDWYNKMDVFVCPSNREAFGNVNIEAMACEVPVIVTNVEALPEIVVNNETGFVVPKGDHNAIAKKIEVLYKDPQKRQAFAKKSLKRALGVFSIKIRVKQYEAVWEEAMRKAI